MNCGNDGRNWRKLLLAASFLSFVATACRSTAANAELPLKSVDEAAIEVVLHELYDSFCFDAGEAADWNRMRELFIEGASFVAPIADGSSAEATGVESFIDDFSNWIENDPMVANGFHERVVATRIERFGNVAQAFVTFEGFVPGESAARTRGVDSIQLVNSAGRWNVAAFASQYERPDLQLPSRYLGQP